MGNFLVLMLGNCPYPDPVTDNHEVEQSKWMAQLEQNPGHSQWYIERFRAMVREGKDVFGEARLIDAMAERNSRILDAGCGGGRNSGYLHSAGHHVTGVDVDPALIEASRTDYPGPEFMVADLATLELQKFPAAFDLILCAGNVMTFLADSTRQAVLRGFRAHLASGGRAVVGFGAGRGYEFQEFFDDAAAAGLSAHLTFSAWDLRPFTDESEFLVAVLGEPLS